MRNRNSLTRQLSIAMAALAFVAVAVSTAAFYIVYAVL